MSKATEKLIESVKLHLLAIETYNGQAVHFNRWGFPGLAKIAADDANEEREHLNALLARLEFFDVQPEYSHDQPNWPRGVGIEGVLKSNLALEQKSAELERAAIVECRAEADEISAKIFSLNLEGSENSIKEIEAAQEIIHFIGVQNYLTNYAKG